MMLLLTLALLLLLPSAVVCDFAYMGDAPPEALHKLVFCVQQLNLDKLAEALHNVSTPTHPDYLKHWTREEVGNLTANPSGTEAVLKFLSNRPGVVNVTATPPFGEYIEAWAPASEWNVLFNTTLSLYHNPDTGKTALRAPAHSPASSFGSSDVNVSVTLPPELAGHVANVFNLAYGHGHLLRQKKRHEDGRGHLKRVELLRSSSSSSPVANVSSGSRLGTRVSPHSYGTEYNNYVTPALINRLYGITSNTGSRSCTHTIYSSIGQSYSLTDHALFTTTFGLPAATVVDYGGHMNNSACAVDLNNCAESNLDLQYIHAMSQGPVLTAWYDDNDDAFVTFMRTIASQSQPPNVISISYGISETAMAAHYSGLMRQFDTEAQKAGLMGTSILVSSGDDGSIGVFKTFSTPVCDYDLSWPASSPYVTAVGATMGPEAGTHNPLAAETVCSATGGSVITSGGGFSIYYNRPSWQSTHTASYLSSTGQTFKGNTYTFGMTADTATRAIPDVSALGNSYIVVIGGKSYGLSGTSASAPMFAGLVSQINSARAQAGLGPLGWLNPTLYAAAAASPSAYAALFTDVTTGSINNYRSSSGSTTTCTTLDSASASASPSSASAMGWAAAAGWDPATGLGTPKFAGLSALLVSAGVGLVTPSPTAAPSPQPSASPTPSPSALPTHQPSPRPSPQPTPAPSPQPSASPTPLPSPSPSHRPSPCPSPQPSPLPSPQPSPLPSSRPSAAPSPAPTTLQPTYTAGAPTPLPTTAGPTAAPSAAPSPSPSQPPSPVPTALPTPAPSAAPSQRPTPAPSSAPSAAPSPTPTLPPTPAPSALPSAAPSPAPSTQPTPTPTAPTRAPTPLPTRPPTPAPSLAKGATAAPTLVVSQVVAVTLAGLSLSDVSDTGSSSGGSGSGSSGSGSGGSGSGGSSGGSSSAEALRFSLRWSLAQVLSVDVSAVGEPRFAQAALASSASATASAASYAAGVADAARSQKAQVKAQTQAQALAQKQTQKQTQRGRQLSQGLTVSFTVTTTATATGGSSSGSSGSAATAAASAAASTTALLQAVSSASEFASYFGLKASQLGAVVPTGVQVTAMVAADATPTLAPSPAPVPASNADAAGARLPIAVIAGGAAGGVVVVVGAVYWVFYYSGSKGAGAASASAGTTVAVSAAPSSANRVYIVGQPEAIV